MSDDLLLELGGIFWSEQPHRAETHRGEGERPIVCGRQFLKRLDLHSLIIPDRRVPMPTLKRCSLNILLQVHKEAHIFCQVSKCNACG